jgi:hypothetical protein
MELARAETPALLPGNHEKHIVLGAMRISSIYISMSRFCIFLECGCNDLALSKSLDFFRFL